MIPSLRSVLMPMVLVLAALSIRAAGAQADLRQDRPSLAGQFLVAAPNMPAAKFQQVVIVIVRNGPGGSMGIAINRPAGGQQWKDLLAVIGERNDNVIGTVPMYSGGPVQPELFFVLHSTDYQRAETMAVSSDIATTSTPKIFHDIAGGAGPKKFLILFGYVGWAPGQLEAELGMKAWFTAPLDPKLVFDADRGTLWEELVVRRPRDL